MVAVANQKKYVQDVNISSFSTVDNWRNLIEKTVGKSKLITCKVSGQPVNSRQLSQKAHIPTVWAVDQKRLYKEDIENIRISYTIWDTFGDHTNDRCFAYAGADAIFICYSTINRRSLKNAEKFWSAEIQKYNIARSHSW
uniref:Uncharacterized protein n=1 Tax=Romanomermis culicivorax TaxID=13658 RepID=A0A915KHK0_ROMCU